MKTQNCKGKNLTQKYRSIMKRFFVLLILLCLFDINVNCQTNSNKNYCIKTIVLDAGHGGKDPGAQSKGYQEKDVTLALVKKVGSKIKEAYPNINIIYTRDNDVFIELWQRAAIANKNHADLFISIHCNASKSTAAFGTETYVMGLHKSKANLEVAKLENASILYEDNYQANYDGYDPNSPESNILFTLMQNAFLDQSLTFASDVESNFTADNRTSRGVKQAGFLVLYRTSTPSVLIESGFITNDSDRSMLVSEEGQEKIATSIFDAFKNYKKAIETKNNISSAGKTSNSYIEKQSEQNNSTYNNSNNNSERTSSSAKYKTSNNVSNNTDTTFKIQFMSMVSLVNTKNKKYSKLQDIDYYKEGKIYKYTTGKFDNKNKASKYLQTVKKSGYKDAFIVTFVGNEKVK